MRFIQCLPCSHNFVHCTILFLYHIDIAKQPQHKRNMEKNVDKNQKHIMRVLWCIGGWLVWWLLPEDLGILPWDYCKITLLDCLYKMHDCIDYTFILSCVSWVVDVVLLEFKIECICQKFPIANTCYYSVLSSLCVFCNIPFFMITFSSKNTISYFIQNPDWKVCTQESVCLLVIDSFS